MVRKKKAKVRCPVCHKWYTQANLKRHVQSHVTKLQKTRRSTKDDIIRRDYQIASEKEDAPQRLVQRNQRKLRQLERAYLADLQKEVAGIEYLEGSKEAQAHSDLMQMFLEESRQSQIRFLKRWASR